MYVSYDPQERGATYVEWEEAPVAATVEISDLVMVDVDAADHPVGIEFALPPSKITEAMIEPIIARFPQLKELGDLSSWLLVGA